MARIEFRAFGPADNQAFFDRCLKEDQIFKDLMFYYCDIEPFTGSWDNPLIPCVMYLGYIGKSIVLRAQRLNHSSLYTVICGEMFGIALPDSLFLQTNDARYKIVESTRALLNSPNRNSYSTLDFDTYRTLYQQAFALDALPDNFPTEFGNDMVTSAEIAIFILECLAKFATKITSYGSVGIFITSMISIIRRGTVSTYYLEKIKSGISDDLGTCPNLNLEAITMFYKRYGKYIDDVNIQVAFDRWTQQIGTKCLRLTLSIQQAAGSGLTCYLTIREAISLYPSFKWSTVVSWYSTEWAKFKRAVETDADNRYWAYRKDIGDAKSTNFKSLGYVAKELLIKVGGQRRLASYGGWPTRIPFKKDMDTLIAEFEASMSEDLTKARTLEIDEEVTNIRQLIVDQGAA